MEESSHQSPRPNHQPNASLNKAVNSPAMPSAFTILAILGGCLFAALMVAGIAILGVFYFVHQQQVQREAEKARMAEQRAIVLQAQREAMAQNQAARQAYDSQSAATRDQERQQKMIETQALADERKVKAIEAEQQARLEMEQRKLEEQVRQGLGQIQAALFKGLNTNDPNCLLAPNSSEGTGLSWRVHLLPALGFKALHSEFHLDEAWDSEHNAALISKMPSLFGAQPQAGMTRIRSFLPLDGDGGRPSRVGDILDGLDQTALLFEVGDEQAVPWTQPDNVHEIEPVTPERLGISDDISFRYTLCGYQTVWNATIMPPEVLRALCTPAGGEHLDDELIAGKITGAALTVRAANLVSRSESKPIVPQSQEEESTEALQKLKRISEAFAQREKQLKTLKDPTTQSGSPLSWRVHLLPFLGENELYGQFDLSQPWNSETNLPLAAAMPDIFKLGTFSGRTRLVLSLPKECRRGIGQLPAAGAITDLPELTALLYLAAPHRGVTWTKPDSTEAMRGSLQKNLGWPETQSILAATYGGTSIEIPASLHPSKLTALISTQRGETFDLQDALESPEQQLKFTPVIRPAEPIPDLIQLPKHAVDVENLKPAVAFKDAARFRTLNYAVYNFYDAYRLSPTNVQSPGKVRSQLSWRVHLLPFLDQKTLYERFKLNEPWDSENNLALLEFMPDVYRSTPELKTKTRLRVLSGNGSLFALDKKWMQAPDGIMDTILFLEVGDPYEQEWTRPDTEIEISSLNFHGLFGQASEINALMGSGEVLRFTPESPSEVMRALATASGNEIIDSSTVHRWLAHQRGESMMQTHAVDRWESERMKQIVLATLNHHDVYQFFPPQHKGDSRDEISLRSSQLSWRVHILPFLGQAALYKQFRLEEPWDSPHNQQLLDSMPDCFRDADDIADSHTTRIVRIMGPETPFPDIGRSPSMRDIRDGTSQTIHFIQVPADDAVPWTRPNDMLVSFNDPESMELIQRLAGTPGLKTATFDGAVRKLAPNVSAESFKGLITPAGSELLKTSELFLTN